MSFHIYCDWKWSDESIEPIVDAVVQGLQNNKWAGRYVPPCFAILTIGDMIFHNLAIMIDSAAEKGETLTETTLNEAVPDSFEYKTKCIEVLKQVLIKMDLLERPLDKAEELTPENMFEEITKNYPLPNRDDFTEHFQQQAEAIKETLKAEAERN